jgi:hypothetical protein
VPIVQQHVKAGDAFGDHIYWHVYGAVSAWTDAHLAKDIADTAQEHLYAGGPTAQAEQFFRPLSGRFKVRSEDLEKHNPRMN